MVEIEPDFKTKKEFLAAVKAGKSVYCIEVMFPIRDGDVVVEAPQGIHKWYAQCVIKDMRIISAK
jgi:hypothetical protein